MKKVKLAEIESDVGDHNLLRARVKQATFMIRGNHILLLLMPIAIFIGFFTELLSILFLLKLLKRGRLPP